MAGAGLRASGGLATYVAPALTRPQRHRLSLAHRRRSPGYIDKRTHRKAEKRKRKEEKKASKKKRKEAKRKESTEKKKKKRKKRGQNRLKPARPADADYAVLRSPGACPPSPQSRAAPQERKKKKEKRIDRRSRTSPPPSTSPAADMVSCKPAPTLPPPNCTSPPLTHSHSQSPAKSATTPSRSPNSTPTKAAVRAPTSRASTAARRSRAATTGAIQ